MPNCTCYGKRGGRIIGARCNFRYESYSFLKGVAWEAPPSAGNDIKAAPKENNGKIAPMRKDDKTARTVITMVVPTVTIIILIVCISVISMKRQKRKLVDRVQSKHRLLTNYMSKES
ncbi:uncharacterized protein LOC132621888 [Lycium barbarum]|uniref:uncharacterized protein LOC132621888 n=1 Tax=Lycium barbarum TaxID=112863 RepID=UPI00293EEE03|nr:uncharacterized protein LOC132621888 [Lycium barbarum]